MSSNPTQSGFKNGFLPSQDPLQKLPVEFNPWEDAGLPITKTVIKRSYSLPAN